VSAARRPRRGTYWLAAIFAGVVVCVSGCKFNGVYTFPLPGAVANGAHTYTVKVQFQDVQDLVPYSAVKVDDATVGHVKSVGVQGEHALVTVQLEDAVKLPANTTALISQTSLLGEKFVALQPPPNRREWRGRLAPGTTIVLANTDSDASAEEVLGALSLLLNGGGLQQIQTITSEVNKALSGHEDNARDLLNQLKTFATGLNRQKNDIINALSKVDHLARTIKASEPTVTNVIDRFPTALKVLTENTAALTKMLTSLSKLGDVAVKVINSSRDDLLTNLRNLQPTLTELAKAGKDIPPSLQILLTYPQADGTQDVYRGDYTNIDVTMDLGLAQLNKNFGLTTTLPTPASGSATTNAPKSGTSPPLTKLPLPVPTIPIRPKLGDGTSGTTGGGGSGSGGGVLGGLLGPSSTTDARVEAGAPPIPLTTPLDRLLLGVLQ
jgi:phospholipid/cholesterol/gamma-HCH transport system substrate-binding protein